MIPKRNVSETVGAHAGIQLTGVLERVTYVVLIVSLHQPKFL